MVLTVLSTALTDRAYKASRGGRHDAGLDKPVGAAVGNLGVRVYADTMAVPTGISIIPPQGDINMKNGGPKPWSNRMGPTPAIALRHRTHQMQGSHNLAEHQPPPFGEKVP